MYVLGSIGRAEDLGTGDPSAIRSHNDESLGWSVRMTCKIAQVLGLTPLPHFFLEGFCSTPITNPH